MAVWPECFQASALTLEFNSTLPKFSTNRRVEFADTDAAGICHFASFFRYMEEAEHATLRSAGLGVLHHEVDGQSVSWPRVAVRCDYRSPAKFEDVLAVNIWVAKVGTKSATFTCEFHLGDREVAVGEVTSVCCIEGDDGRPKATEIPGTYRAALDKLRL